MNFKGYLVRPPRWTIGPLWGLQAASADNVCCTVGGNFNVSYAITDPFNTNYMRAVFNLGYARMANGSLWKDRPSFADTLAAAQTAQWR
ncbi:Hypothetical protein NGAL_HAMBI2566_57870 [Neorhizobium galegae bv. orientalis]|nr:Hypothetical protein NGAL_HAMBI2566_57870 [Neorhizobium galegae bv. orientalis]CDZ73703.1 Hypothetical protein NGAL_HAMBI2610_53350 [Neorhizobium galegae bv. orientalis]